MTSGSPARQISIFALPMLIGNLFLQLYNIVDTVVVGHFLGRDALAAVGSAFAVMVFVNSLIVGLCIGSAVLFAQLYGAKDYQKLKIAVVMSGIFIFLATAVISVLCLCFTRPILELYQMPPEIIGLAAEYLQCIFAGLLFIALYSWLSNLLRAMGDSITPLYFLALSCIINVVLAIVFVVPLGMGVFGSALATVIAQMVAGVLCAIYTVKKLRFLHFSRKDFILDKPLAYQLFRISVLTSVQQSVMNFGILLVQGLVNTFGVALMAAFSAGVKIDAFAYMPVQDLGNAFSTFTAQNTRAK